MRLSLVNDSESVHNQAIFNGLRPFFTEKKDAQDIEKKLRSYETSGKILAAVAGAGATIVAISLVSKVFFLGLTIAGLTALSLIGRDFVIVSRNAKKIAMENEDEKKKVFVEQSQAKAVQVREFVKKLFENTWILDNFESVGVFYLTRKAAPASL